MTLARISLVAAILSLLASGLPSHSAPAGTAPTYDVPSYFNRSEGKPLTPVWAQRLTGYLKTRDGVSLRFSVLLPKDGSNGLVVQTAFHRGPMVGGNAPVEAAREGDTPLLLTTVQAKALWLARRQDLPHMVGEVTGVCPTL